jgi:DNA-directed RNA polymerase specialized sigma subunit
MVLSDLKESHERKQAKSKKELKNLSLEKQVARYKVVCNEFKTFQDQLAGAFYILSENIAAYAKFTGIDLDDAIQEGVVICFEKIDRFDPRKGKAFNYMTTCILNHYRQIYRSQRNYQELKKRYLTYLQDKVDSFFYSGGKRGSSKFSIDIHENSDIM